MNQTRAAYKVLIISVIFVSGLFLRLVFAPGENRTADPFEVLAAAKTLAETGRYLVPTLGSSDLKTHYTFAGWPVGFPLMLFINAKIFGQSEVVARLFTISLSSLTIVFVIVIANLFFGSKVGYLAGCLMAIHPLLVAFSGRIFTNNPALLFLFASTTFLLLSVIEKDRELKFVDLSAIPKSQKRLFSFLMSFLLLGYLLTIRDTMAMFLPVYLYVFYKSGLFRVSSNRPRLKVLLKLFLMAGIVFIVGYLPSIYFNYQNYGTIIASAHYQWGVRLNLGYLLFGRGSSLRLPGAVVILLSGLIYCFPLISLFFVREFTKKNAFFITIFVLMFLPILIINGSFHVSSTGAAPRYMLPLIPLVCILTANSLMNLSKHLGAFWRAGLFVVIAGWLLFLTYPIPVLFRLSPKFAYAAHYAPAYQIYPFENYPSHVNAVAKWVKDFTPENSVIIVSPSNPYHFYYYAGRDIITHPNITAGILKDLIDKRPIFLAEDHEATYNPVKIDKIKTLIKAAGLSYSVAGEIKLFSPKVGHTEMHVYQLTNLN